MVYPAQVLNRSYQPNLDMLKVNVNPLSRKESSNQSPSVSEYMEGWLHIKQPALRMKTVEDYLRLILKYIQPAFNHTDVAKLTSHDLCLFFLDLQEQSVGNRTIRYIHSVLRVALKSAVTQGIIAINPTDGAILPRWNKKEMQVLDESQISGFLNVARHSPYFGIFHFAIATGMRMGEILGLKWCDVDWSNSILFIRRQAQRVNGHGIIFQEPKTRANNLRRNFKQNLQRAGLPNIRFHDLRHTAATLMINHEVPITVVSQILGHSKPSVTLDIYSHCSVAMQTNASLIMDAIVKI